MSGKCKWVFREIESFLAHDSWSLYWFTWTTLIWGQGGNLCSFPKCENMLHWHSDGKGKYQHCQFISYVKGIHFMLFRSGINQQCPACFLFCGFNLGIHPKPYLGMVFYSLMPKKHKRTWKNCTLKISQGSNLSLSRCMLAISPPPKTKSYAEL